MTLGMFKENGEGQVEHTALSSVLVRQPASRDWVHFCVEESSDAAAKLVNAMDKGHPGKRSPFQVALNIDLLHFQWMSERPEKVQIFANTMRTFGETEGYTAKHLVDGWDWQSLGESKVVDVGLAKLKQLLIKAEDQ